MKNQKMKKTFLYIILHVGEGAYGLNTGYPAGGIIGENPP